MKEVSVVLQLRERDTVQLGVGYLGSAPQLQCTIRFCNSQVFSDQKSMTLLTMS